MAMMIDTQDSKVWLRKMLQLRLRIADTRNVIFGSNVSAMLLSAAYIAVNPTSPMASTLVVLAGVSMAGTTLLLGSIGSSTLEKFKRMFETPRVGIKAMHLAHDMLFILNGKQQVKPLRDALNTIQGAIYTEDDWYPGLHQNSDESNVRVSATGIKLRTRMSGTVEVMATQIVREAMYHIVSTYRESNAELTPAAQQYILENDPLWVQWRPELFDGPSVELAYPGLLGTIIAVKAIGFDDTAQSAAVRQWLADRLEPARQELAELPSL
jgi:hypothetical protein